MTETLYSAIRSLCRFRLMKDEKYPDVLLETEQEILNGRLKKLSKEDISYINNNFDKLYQQYIIDHHADEFNFMDKINKEMKSWN